MTTQTVTVKLHILKVIDNNSYMSRDVGSVCVDTYDLSTIDACSGCYVLLDTKEVEVEYKDRDVTGEAIEAIEKQSEEIMAKARAAVEKNNERIANLRCLTHQPGDGDIEDGEFVDIPF